MNGKVLLIGAGPGDPSLLTLKGKEYIENADCIVYDRLASPELLSYAKKGCEFVYVGKKNHHHTMKQEDINQLLYEMAAQGKDIVRLKGGDPYVFGRGGEEALFLKERGISVEVVPGISSSIAALADAGIPITHRGLSKGFQVITAHSKKDQTAEIDYSQLLDPTVTYVFLMGLAHVGEIAQGLIKAGRTKETPAAVISNGTTAKQKKCVGRLENIAALVEKANLESPAIIVVGDVVTLSGELDFFESRPLFGKRFLVPYIEKIRFSYSDNHFDSELEVKLRELGADVYSLKVGRIVQLELDRESFKRALTNDWLIFTSQNGVHAFLWNLKKHGLDIRAIANSKLAVVGKRTQESLMKAFLQVDFLPQEQTGKGLCQELMKIAKAGERLAFFGAKDSNPEIEQMLSPEYEFTKYVCYENSRVEPEPTARPEESWDTFDGVIFTSASSVRRTLAITEGLCPKNVFSIGPKCSEELDKHNISDYTEASEFNYRGIIDTIIQTEEDTNGKN